MIEGIIGVLTYMTNFDDEQIRGAKSIDKERQRAPNDWKPLNAGER